MLLVKNPGLDFDNSTCGEYQKWSAEIPSTPPLHHSSTPFPLRAEPRKLAGITESFQAVNEIHGSLRSG